MNPVFALQNEVYQGTCITLCFYNTLVKFQMSHEFTDLYISRNFILSLISWGAWRIALLVWLVMWR